MKKRPTYFTIVLCLVLLAACTSSPQTKENRQPPTDQDKLSVAVSILPQKEFVHKVAGDLVDIHVLVPPNHSPEQYEPTPKDMIAFENADIYFTMGVPVEATVIDKLLSDTPDLKVISLVDAYKEAGYKDLLFEEDQDHHAGHDSHESHEGHEGHQGHVHTPGQRDHHAWLSPQRVIPMVEAISTNLQDLDPAHADTYKANAQAYIQDLQALDKDIADAVAQITNPTFLCYHPAYAYLADDYKITMIPLEEDGHEASPARLQKVIDQAKAENIKVVFYQAEIDSRQAESLAREIQGKTVMLEPLAENYIDNLHNMVATILETQAS